MIHKITDYLLLGLITICGAATTTAVVWTWVPSPAAYMSTNIESQHAEQVGNFIHISRSYCVRQQIPVTITRDMIKVDTSNNIEVRYTLPETTQIYAKGCHSIQRVFPIPDGVTPGKYKLLNTASWQANPMRQDSTVLPSLTLTIDPK